MKNTQSFFKWDHIHFMGTTAINWENPYVYRYMSYRRVKEILRKREITFVSPKKWEDPYEKIYLNAKVVCETEKIPNIACLCVRTNPCENSDAFWNWSKIKKEWLVRVKINLYKLCSDLEKFASENNARIYLSSVNYKTKTYIANASKNEKIVKGSLEKSFVRLMSLKRHDFEYEDELRIFIVWNRTKKLQAFKDDGLLKIGCHLNCIERITVQPHIKDSSFDKIDYELNSMLGKKRDIVYLSAFDKVPAKRMLIKFPLNQ